MSDTESIPPSEQEAKKSGHIDSLDPEQTGKLQQIWKKFLDVTRDVDVSAAPKANGSPGGDPAATGAVDEGSGKDAAKSSAKDDKAKEAEAAEKESRGLDELLQQHGAAKFKQAFWDYCILEDPDSLMLRFLRARSWDVEKAFAMLASTVKWRIETDVRGILEKGEEGLCEEPGVKKNLSMAKCYFHGTDRQGRSVVYARVKHHKAADQTQEEMLKYVVFNMESSRGLLPLGAGQETASVVFDMSGFGLSNMDWDTATMVIKIFQSYYPETLGHAIIWNSPTVFSAVWKIVKPMLDPVVREKIHFASSASDIAKYIDPKHLEKDFGGTSSWTYRFRQPAKGENEHMKDEDAKKKRVEAYEVATKKYEELTQKWIDGDSEAEKERREKTVKELLVRQFDLDPYIRGKTSFTRDGTQVGDGRVIWHYDHGHNEEFGTSANEYASDLGIEDPPSRPENGDGSQTVVLSSDEDTCSSTDDSENDALDDPHHKHHSSVTVGMAKLGDGVANTFSKITPGPSLHEKQRAKKEARHKRHEERRKRKLEAKKKRLEIERRQQEEEEERERQKTDEQREEEVNSSYQAYLAKMAELTLDVGHKAAGYVPAFVGGNYLASITETHPTSVPATPAAVA